MTDLDPKLQAAYNKLKAATHHNPNSPYCSACNKKVSGVPKDVVAVLCSQCTYLLSELAAKGYGRSEEKVRKCECGAILPKHRQVCDSCARKHRSETYRASKRKKLLENVRRATEVAFSPSTSSELATT